MLHLFTSIEVAHFLNVSRPFVTKLLKEKQILYIMFGSHRRITYEDLQANKIKMRSHHEQILQELADQAQELNLGY